MQVASVCHDLQEEGSFEKCISVINSNEQNTKLSKTHTAFTPLSANEQVWFPVFNQSHKGMLLCLSLCVCVHHLVLVGDGESACNEHVYHVTNKKKTNITPVNHPLIHAIHEAQKKEAITLEEFLFVNLVRNFSYDRKIKVIQID
jgi:hypothetical protein